jgi:diguanylate cyclase (GGDEF)-like protein
MDTVQEGLLRQIKLLQAVDLESIQGLLDACTFRSLATDEVLIRKGELNRTVYFLLTGKVRVHLDTPEGPPTAVLGIGESVGEMSVIDHQPASAFVVAQEATELLAMDEEILWSLVQSSHAAACNLLVSLTTRLRHTDSVVSGSGEVSLDYRRLGTIDALTGLHNRLWLENVIDRHVQRAGVSGKPLSVLLIDIDYFRTFNERYGRAYGDHILYSLAHTLASHFRPTETIVRYGGDAFMVLLPDTAIEAARQIGDRVQPVVMEAVPALPDGRTVPHPTLSIGLAMLQPGQTGRELLAEASRALARAKHGGGNGCSE